MKRLAIIPTVFTFVACLALLGCGDLTGPSLDELGPPLLGVAPPPPKAPPPDCIIINLDGPPDFCEDRAEPPPPDHPTGNPR